MCLQNQICHYSPTSCSVSPVVPFRAFKLESQQSSAPLAPSSLFRPVMCRSLPSDVSSHHTTTLALIKVSRTFCHSNTSGHFFGFILLETLAGFSMAGDLMTAAPNTFFSWLPGHLTFFFSILSHCLFLIIFCYLPFITDVYILEFSRAQSLDCFSFLSILIPQMISFNPSYGNIFLFRIPLLYF